MIKRRLSRIPFIYKIRVIQLRTNRRINNVFVKFARHQSNNELPYAIKRHQSLLRRKLGASDPQLQENKVANLGIAIKKIDKIEINPGENFSFWDLVGKPTIGKGYIEERNHQFHCSEDKNYRENEIWRREIDKRTGTTRNEELIVHNYSEVKYIM
ncbi:MAG TPA: VanW family protein [Paenibacillus sp.]|jgi:hypothetical protein